MCLTLATLGKVKFLLTNVTESEAAWHTRVAHFSIIATSKKQVSVIQDYASVRWKKVEKFKIVKK